MGELIERYVFILVYVLISSSSMKVKVTYEREQR